MTLEAAAKVAARNPTEARVIYSRPSLTQEIDWRPAAAEPGGKPEAVREATLSFLNGELYRIAVVYDRSRVEGMTADDIVQSISETYGPAATPVAEVAFKSVYGDTVPVVARWGDSDYSWNLIRSGDRTTFALILFVKRLETLAAAAAKESARLDVVEAPQRELAKRKQREADQQTLLEKARAVNKPAFRP